MSDIEIKVPAGEAKRLLVAGKRHTRNIVVTAEGGADRYEEGVADGKQAEYNAFWDMFQENGNRIDYQYAFSLSWTDECYNPKYPILCGSETAYTANGLFMSSTITDTKVPITVSGTRADTMFQHCINLKRIPSITFIDVIRFSNTFRNCLALEEISVQGEIGVNISFSESPLLAAASVQSIIDHLKDMTGATAQTLTFHATVGGKLTAEQKAAISAKNWTLFY